MDRGQLLELELWGVNGFNASYSSYLIQDRPVIFWPLFPLLSTWENKCVNSMEPLVRQIWRQCEFLRWKRRCIDFIFVCNEQLPIITVYLECRKYFLGVKHGDWDKFWDIVWKIYVGVSESKVPYFFATKILHIIRCLFLQLLLTSFKIFSRSHLLCWCTCLGGKSILRNPVDTRWTNAHEIMFSQLFKKNTAISTPSTVTPPHTHTHTHTS